MFFNYGFDKEKSKILYSHYRRSSNSFCGTMFDRHKMWVENCEVDAECSNIYFFSVLHHRQVEGINQYLRNISISPIDIKQEQWNVWAENTPPLDLQAWFVWFRKKNPCMSHAIYKCLEHINNLSNSNLVRKTDGLLWTRKVNTTVNWVDSSVKVSPQKFKVNHYFFRGFTWMT